MTQIHFIICIYFGILIGIGYFASRKNKTFADYILGGRKLGPVLGAMNAGASDMSSWLLMGLPGAFYLFGLSQAWMILGLVVGSFASWTLIAKRLRLYTEIAGNSLTVSAFLENRFRDKTGILRSVTSAIMIIFLTIYICSGFVAGAKLFSGVLGISYIAALSACVFFTIIYTFIGGFLAISWADMFQGTLVLFALLVVPFVMLSSLGGFDHTLNIIQTRSIHHLDVLHNVSFSTFLGLFAWGLGYFGQPQIISKYMAISNPNDIKVARNICIIWMFISMIGAGLVGLLGLGYYESLVNHEMIFIEASREFFHPIITGVMVCAVISAIMSTVNAQLMICSSAITNDVYKRLCNGIISENKLVWISRCAIVLVTSVAFIFALDQNSTVLGLVKYAWAGLGSSIGPAIICSLFFRFITRNAIILGILSGGISSILLAKFKLVEFDMLISFSLSFAVILLYSFVDQKNRIDGIDDDFKKMNEIIL